MLTAPPQLQVTCLAVTLAGSSPTGQCYVRTSSGSALTHTGSIPNDGGAKQPPRPRVPHMCDMRVTVPDWAVITTSRH